MVYRGDAERVVRARRVVRTSPAAAARRSPIEHLDLVDDVRRRIDEFIESGVQHFELKVIYPTMDSLNRQMELWAENILPRYN